MRPSSVVATTSTERNRSIIQVKQVTTQLVNGDLMPSHTIFYSWQSDLPNSVNRGFIEDCLQRAIKELQADEGLKLDPCLDRDTSGIPGSPDIAATIFEKIDAAHIFVADVSFIDQDATGRRTPNPNVLIELGYAARCLGWERIICVFNRAFGDISELPFDLRQRRARSYELIEGSEKADQRTALVSALRDDVKSILHAPDQAAQVALQQLLSAPASELITIIIFGQEVEQRSMNPWLDSLRFQFEQSARILRELATRDAAIRHSLVADLQQLTELLDNAAHLRLHSGSWPEYFAFVTQATEKATIVKRDQIDSVPLATESLCEVLSTLVKTKRQLEELAARAAEMPHQGRLDELQTESSQIGLTLLRLGNYSIDGLQAGLSKRLLEIGRDLHLVETMQVYLDGGRSVAAVVDRVQKNSKELSELSEALTKSKATEGRRNVT